MSKVIGLMLCVGGYRENLQDFKVKSVETGFARPHGSYYYGIDENDNRYEVPYDCYLFKRFYTGDKA